MKIVPINEIPLAKPVDLTNLEVLLPLIEEMAFICQNEEGIGLSAVQIGVPFDLFLIQLFNGYHVFLNTRYEPVNKDDTITSKEGCLSLKNEKGECITYEVPRFKQIKLYGHELKLSDLSLHKLNGYTVDHEVYNVVFQHEIDHSSGILISQIGKEC